MSILDQLSSAPLYLITGAIILYVAAMSVFFLVRAWKAGVAIGMSQVVMAELPAFGAEIRAVVLCATLIYELVGPFLTKVALLKAGEIHEEGATNARGEIIHFHWRQRHHR